MDDEALGLARLLRELAGLPRERWNDEALGLARLLRELAGLPRKRVADVTRGLARLLRELAGLSRKYAHAWPLERSGATVKRFDPAPELTGL